MTRVRKLRLDQKLVEMGLAPTRSQAENLIRLEKVVVDGKIITKTGYFVSGSSKIELIQVENYVSRGGLKLAGANRKFKIDFIGKVVLDVGSSTGGFTDYALRRGAKRVIAVDVGTGQLHPKLRAVEQIELHEKTDIRNFKPKIIPDIILVDVSFISVKLILLYLVSLSVPKTQIVVLLKPQFEAGIQQINRGIIKNDRIRRQIFKDFENWTKNVFKIVNKTDSEVPGRRGNLERFYLLQKVK